MLGHFIERNRETIESSNLLHKDFGTILTIHGRTNVVSGNAWSMVEHLHRTSLHAETPIKSEMIPAIQKALETDIKLEIPPNYQKGAGDTYFSGKIMAKLARILIIAEEVGGVSDQDFQDALDRLKSALTVWFDGTAKVNTPSKKRKKNIYINIFI